MKIAVSAKSKTADSLLDIRFGRCEYFQIYDGENDEVKVIDNKGKLSGSGAGVAAAQQLVDEKVNLIITGSLGPNAYEIVEKAGIKIYKCRDVSISSALEKFNKDELLELVKPSRNGTGHGFRGGR